MNPITVGFHLTSKAVVMLPDYDRLRTEFTAANRVLPDPYFLCAQLVMMESGFIMAELNKSAATLQKAM